MGQTERQLGIVESDTEYRLWTDTLHQSVAADSVLFEVLLLGAQLMRDRPPGQPGGLSCLPIELDFLVLHSGVRVERDLRISLVAVLENLDDVGPLVAEEGVGRIAVSL